MTEKGPVGAGGSVYASGSVLREALPAVGQIMPEQQVEIGYAKSPEWRVVTATGVGVGAIGTQFGLEIQLRFTYEWIDVIKETFTADVTPSAVGGSTIVVKGLPLLTQGPMLKIEEVAVRMGYDPAVNLAASLLTQFSQLDGAHRLSDQQFARIEEAFKQLRPK